MVKISTRSRRRRAGAPMLRLSAQGRLRRYALLSGMGMSVLAGNSFAGGAQSAGMGSAAWVAQMNAARAGGLAGGSASLGAGSAAASAQTGAVVTAQQAQQRAQASMQDLANAIQNIATAQAAQQQAHQTAVNNAGTGPTLVTDPATGNTVLVTDGLSANGLAAASGAAQNVADPKSCTASYTCVWQGANLPTQSVANGQYQVQVQQNQQDAILTWQSFNVGAHTTLSFNQSAGTQTNGSNNWVALNRVENPSADPAVILGSIKAQGDVYIIDGNGVIFTGSSQVNTHSLLVSSLALFNTDDTLSNSTFFTSGLAPTEFLNTPTLLVSGASTGGAITIQQGASISGGELGFVFLAAPQLSNAGSLSAVDGQIILAATNGMSLSDSPSRTNNAELAVVSQDVVDVRQQDYTLTNDGVVFAQRGNVTLLGLNVEQDGVVGVTDSLTRQGSIVIDTTVSSTADLAPVNGYLNFGPSSITAILPDDQRVIQALGLTADTETTTSTAQANSAFNPGAAQFTASSVTFESGALVEAPGASVSVTAIAEGYVPTADQAITDPAQARVQGRVYVDGGATIDVSGLADVELPVADTLVTIGPITENELADSPLLRGGFLIGKTVTVDSTLSGTLSNGTPWVGSPIIDATGYVQAVPRGVDQLLTNGGTLNLLGGEVITAPNSFLNLSGGYVNYLSGMTQGTTNLVGADGHIYNIGSADPEVGYVGIVGQQPIASSRWNLTTTYSNSLLDGSTMQYEAGFIQGGKGGTLNVGAYGSGDSVDGTAILDGAVSAQAYAGRNQVASGSLQAGGTFSIGSLNGASLYPLPGVGAPTGPSYLVTNTDVNLATIAQDQGAAGFVAGTSLPAGGSSSDLSNLQYWSLLNAATLSDAGFSAIKIQSSNGQIQVGCAANTCAAALLKPDVPVELSVQPGATSTGGGEISLTAQSVTIYGELSAHSGEIDVTVPIAGASAAVPIPGSIYVDGSAVLDASGEWVNDTGLTADQIGGSALLNGGKISLIVNASVNGSTQDATGSILLQPGSTLNVSSGGYVQPDGKLLTGSGGLPLGQAGSITLETYAGQLFVIPPGIASLPEAGTIGMLDGNGQVVAGLYGNVLGYGFSGGGSLTLQALGFQIGGAAPGEPYQTVYLPANLFSGQDAQVQGFGSYQVNAEYGLSVAAPLSLTQQNLLLDPANYATLLQAPTGAPITGTGGLIGSGALTAGALPAYYRPHSTLRLTAGDSQSWFVTGAAAAAPLPAGDLVVAAPISADAQAGITLGSAQSVQVLAGIAAPGGTVLINGQTALSIGSTNPASLASTAVVLGAGAVIDVSGTALINPYASPEPGGKGQSIVPVTGTVLPGGTVAIYGDTVTAQAGAEINVSGAGTVAKPIVFDLPQPSGAYGPQEVWSDAGSITLAARDGLTFNGTLSAQPGSGLTASGAVATGSGGSLTLTALDNASTWVLQQCGGTAACTPAAPLDFFVDGLSSAGIWNLTINSEVAGQALPQAVPLTLAFAGNVNLSLQQSFVADVENLAALPAANGAAATVNISAPYVNISGNYYTYNGNAGFAATPPAAGTATLNINALTQVAGASGFIDLGGAFELSGFQQANFNSTGAIRFYTPYQFDYVGADVSPQRGELVTEGNLSFTAADLYPATGNRFVIDAYAPVGAAGTTVTINQYTGPGAVPATVPLSAGGSLLIDATSIEQNGTLWAPSGSIVLGVGSTTDPATQALFNPVDPGQSAVYNPLPLVATQTVSLGGAGKTSVSLGGAVISYGTTTDQLEWYYNGSGLGSNASSQLSAPPAKLIEIDGASVALAPGATVDLSGGGDLQAEEWIPGIGGTRDVLSQYNTSYVNNPGGGLVPLYPDARGIYALVPGYEAPVAAYDPVYQQGQAAIGLGQAVELSGAAGIPAGTYVLLPAKYATLPGALRIVQDTGTGDTLPGQNTTLEDGTELVSGYFVNRLSGAQEARSTFFEIQSGAVWGQYSQYALTGANSFFAAQATQAGTATPQLARDAGQLVLGASTNLELPTPAPGSPGVNLDTSAASGGAPAEIDIAAQDIAITGKDQTALPAGSGYVTLTVDELDGLGAGSLLIGGTRTRTSSGVTVNALANSVVLNNDTSDPLNAPTIMLVAKTDPGGVDLTAGNNNLPDGILVESGSVITAKGTLPATAAQSITIGQLASSAVLGSNGSVIVPAAPAISGDGSLLVASVGAQPSITRLDVPGLNGVAGSAIGRLEIQANATLNGGSALTLDSSGDTIVSPTASFAATDIAADGRDIVFVNGNAAPANATGLIVGSNTLAQFAAAQQVALRSYGSIDFEGNVDVAVGKTLILSAGSFTDGAYGQTGAVKLSAATLGLTNDFNAPELANPLAGTGSLDLSASQIDLGTAGATVQSYVNFSGFGSLTATASTAAGTANATAGIVGAGSTAFDLGGLTVTLNTPVLIAATASNTTLNTTLLTSTTTDTAGAGSIALNSVAGQPLAFAATPLGGQLSLVGGTVSTNATISAPAGNIALEATAGNLSVAAGAVIDVAGAAKQFYDVTEYAPGGNISLTADLGQVVVQTGATLDFSGAVDANGKALGGNAGSLSVSAPAQTAQIEGTIQGGAAPGYRGGSFSESAGGAVDLDALANGLVNSGVDNVIAVSSGSGDLDLSSTLSASQVSLTANGGAVNISGTINASGFSVTALSGSGQAGGEIDLYGQAGVSLTGKLLATSSPIVDQNGKPVLGQNGQPTYFAGQRGGTVNIGTSGTPDGTLNAQYGYENIASSGAISIGPNAVIDVSGGAAGGHSGGSVNLRAPLLSSGDVNVEIDPAAQIKGATAPGAVSLEAYAVWSTTDASANPAQHFDGVIDPAGWYDGSGQLVAGTFTDQNGEVVAVYTPASGSTAASLTPAQVAADLANDYFTPANADAAHQTFYGYVNGDSSQGAGTLMSFVENFGAYPALQSRVNGIAAQVSGFQLVPGIELDNPGSSVNAGNIQVLSNWNLGATNAQGSLVYRYGGQAPILTVRAANNLQIDASVSDGFIQQSAGPQFTYSAAAYQLDVGFFNTDSPLLGPATQQTVTVKGTSYTLGSDYAAFGAPGQFQSSNYYTDYSTYATAVVGWGSLATTLNAKLTVAPTTLGTGAPDPGAPAYTGNYGAYVTAYEQWLTATYPKQASLSTTPPPPQQGASLADYAQYLQAYAAYEQLVRVDDGGNFHTGTPIAYIYPPLPPSQGATVDATTAGGNLPSNMANLNNLAPLAFATLAGGGSSSYRFVAGADLASADPLALAPLSQFGGSGAFAGGGNVTVDGHGSITDETSNSMLVFPTVIRTGTGFIEIAAADDIALLDNTAPGAIYTAGVPVAGTNVSNSVGTVAATTDSQEVVVTGAVNPTAAGDIVLHAQNNIISQEDITDTTGAITGTPGLFIGQFWWPWLEAGNPGNGASSSINFAAFDQGVMSLGGNVTVNAGGNIQDLGVSLPTTWNLALNPSGAPVGGGGNLAVSAGGNIVSGDYFVAKGSGSIASDGAIVADSFTVAGSPVATLFGLQDASLQISARQSADIGGVYDPSYVGSPQGAMDSQGYSQNSSISVNSTSGAIQFDSLGVAAGAAVFEQGQRGSGTPQGTLILPASVNLTALDDGISFLGPGELYPSSSGELSLVAAQTVSFDNSADPAFQMLALSDAQASLMPSPTNPLGSTNGSLSAFFGHQGGPGLQPLHVGDTTPVRIYSLDGSIVDGGVGPNGFLLQQLLIEPDKQALIYAAGDIVDLCFLGQNLYDSDVTRIVAGGDISDTPLASTGSIAPESGIYTLIPSLQLGGPGTFDVEAGRNLGPLASQLEVVNQGFGGSHITGIDTVGNLYNPYLAHQSASIDVLFGVGPGIDLADFIAGYIDPAASTVGVPSYSSELVTFMEQYEAGLNYAYGDGLLQDQQQAAVTLSPQQAWTDFQGLNPKVPMPSYVQQLFVEQVFNNVLFLTGQDYNDTASAYYHQYARGYAAINTLFPPAYGYTQNALHGGDNGSNQPVITGNLDVRGSTIQTQQGGGINIFGPGGQALIASASAPPYVSAGGQVLAGPNTEGILTLEQGDINIYTDDSVLLAQSRVFTEQGGNILIWSSNGDINAGNGTKATAYVPPLQYSCDQYEYCIVEPAGEVTGAGIATLQTIADAPPGDVELVTPRGTVDAGNAGIRVSGNLTIAALHVANVYNIQVQGKTVGLPSTHVDTGALTTASSAVAAAEAAAELAAQAAPGEVLVQVEVVGFGVPDEEQKRRIRREHHRNTR